MASMNVEPKLAISGVSKSYKTRSGVTPALHNFGLSVAKGEFVSIVGPSGCGKSTLLWSAAGLHSLDRGQILLDGEPITRPHPQVAMVFQEANLLPWQSLMKNVELPLRLQKAEPGPTRERIRGLLTRVGLQGFEDRFPRELSGGMQQRASIVRALSTNPSVLLMDEPFSALDPFTREDMALLLEEIWLETRKTVLFITHSISEAVFLSDRVVVMSGRPGQVRRIFDIDIPRPRPLSVMEEHGFIDIVAEIKAAIGRGTAAVHRVAEKA
jgi:NitT/TauT family transport system ATP-binding protein